MGELADQLKALGVSVRSPDGCIEVLVSGSRELKIKLIPGAYEGYDESRISYQLAQVATRAWAKLNRRYIGIVETAFGGALVDDLEAKRYIGKLAAIEAQAEIPRSGMRARTQGLVRWNFDFAAGMLGKTPEREFLRNFGELTATVLARYQNGVILAKHEIYGIGVPDWLFRRTPRSTN